MAAAARKHGDLALRRIDVKSWKSPVAKQYGIRSLPTFQLYDSRGKLVAQGMKALKRVRAWKPAKRKTSQSKTKVRARSTAGSPSPGPVTGGRSIRVVSKRGEKVDFRWELAKGRYTLFEFYADWCSESGKRAPELQSAVRRTNDLMLCRINVPSLKSPVARQHKIKSLPYFVLFDPSGKLVKRGSDIIEDVLKWGEWKAARPPR